MFLHSFSLSLFTFFHLFISFYLFFRYDFNSSFIACVLFLCVNSLCVTYAWSHFFFYVFFRFCFYMQFVIFLYVFFICKYILFYYQEMVSPRANKLQCIVYTLCCVPKGEKKPRDRKTKTSKNNKYGYLTL